MRVLRERTVVRQHQIFDAVRDLIINRGMEGVTINSIADAVGLTEGAIYRHFSSKQQILSLLIDDTERSLLDTVEKAQVVGESALENLKHILDSLFSEKYGSQAVTFVIITEAMGFNGIGLSNRVLELMNRFLESAKRVLRQGVEDGTLHADLDSDAAATAFLGLVQSLATLWALSGYVRCRGGTERRNVEGVHGGRRSCSASVLKPPSPAALAEGAAIQPLQCGPRLPYPNEI